MNRTNYHSHCTFCDGRASIEDFVAEAVRLGFTSYGVSSHAPLPFGAGWTMDEHDMPTYLAEIDRLKKQYAGTIEIYAGLEIDYLDIRHNAGSPYFQSLPLDFRIGSVHMLHVRPGKIIDIDTPTEVFKFNLEQHLENDLENVLLSYFEKSVEMVRAGGFDFIGHADKLSRHAEILQPGITDESWYEDAWRALLREIRDSSIMMEINTKMFWKTGLFFPHRKHFQKIGEYGIPVLVNSDCHRLELIDSGRSEALEALSSAGINTVMELHAGKWVAVPIV